jgi:MATE family multidrug resistance protein
MKALNTLRLRWGETNGYRDVLSISLPLVASMASITFMHFTDRVFLSHYSVEAIAAAMPAGIASFTLCSFFLGVAGYSNTFIAQYTGSGETGRVGASLWQALYFSLFAGVLLAALALPADALFSLMGHEPGVRHLETIYFRILMLGACFNVLEWSLACFYAGRGITRVVMVVNVLGAAFNIPLDYALINGVWFFPEWGIAGAAIATVASYAFMCGLYALLIFTKKNDRVFGVISRRTFDRELFGRMMKYGLPKGVQFFMDIFAFTFFVAMVGRLGTVELAATNIVFTINMMGFLPMVGFSIGTSALVGQAIGRGRPDRAARAVSNSLHLTMAYIAVVALTLVVLPYWLVDIFTPAGPVSAESERIRSLGVVLLKFVALYCLFDTLNLIYSAALEGAGDTRFVMAAVGTLSLGLMVAPTYVGIRFFGLGIYEVWSLIVLYLITLAGVFLIRYRGGKWKGMRVIEAPQGGAA